jgi:uncharacterized protein (TIGR03545 family)
MPPKKDKENQPPKKERFKGETIVFPNDRTRPRFWIGRMGLSGVNGEGTSNELRYSGFITDISSEQHVTGRPTFVEIRGAFTQREQSEMRIDLRLDHRREQINHVYRFFLSGYDLDGAQFWDEQIVPLKITSGLGQIDLVIEISGEEIHGELTLQGVNLRYAKDPEATGIQRLVAEAIMSAPELRVSIGLTGTLRSHRLWINTNVDSLIKARLEREFGDQIANARAQILAEYERVVGDVRAEIEATVRRQENEIASAFAAQQAALENEATRLTARQVEIERALDAEINRQAESIRRQAEEALRQRMGF